MDGWITSLDYLPNEMDVLQARQTIGGDYGDEVQDGAIIVSHVFDYYSFFCLFQSSDLSIPLSRILLRSMFSPA
jgi:hypothetical protein